MGWVKKDDRLFTLDVFLIDGPISEKFAKKNKVVCRTIKMRGDQTLEDLHYTIFHAFNREEQHMYEFQVGGKGPMDPKARRYVLSGAMNKPYSENKPAGDVARTTIGSIELKKDDAFGYWFDFGDNWWHQINVVGIDETAPPGKYPRVTKRVGQSPPQYMGCDEED
jgi:hypothetical protein